MRVNKSTWYMRTQPQFKGSSVRTIKADHHRFVFLPFDLKIMSNFETIVKVI